MRERVLCLLLRKSDLPVFEGPEGNNLAGGQIVRCFLQSGLEPDLVGVETFEPLVELCHDGFGRK